MKSLLSSVSLKNKIFFSFLGVTLLISVTIAFLARWILVSSLTSELEMRGSAIAHSVAERGSAFLLDKDYPKLLALIVDEARLRERKSLVSYLFITDQKGEAVSHTFVFPFPRGLDKANELDAVQQKSVLEVTVNGVPAYDIAVPIKEGLYRIGTVHVGLSKTHMDNLVATLRNTFLGFITLTIVITFVLSHRFSRKITRPITELTKISDEVSRGNFDISLPAMGMENGWDASKCPAYDNTDLPCWHFDQSAHSDASGTPHTCGQCVFYKKREGDEVVQLSDSFRNMIWSIKLYRRRLRESEEKYRSLFDSGPDPIFVVDCKTHEIIDANPRAQELYGYGTGELIGASFVDLGPEHIKECLIFFEESDTASGCVYYPKMLHYKKGGQPFFVNVHACPISYKGRRSIIVAATDITEMIEKDAQLIQAAKMKSLGEMSAGIAHELNQPLNAIQLGSEYLSYLSEQGKDIPRDKLDKVVSAISSQVSRATEIINTLRSFGRKADIFKEDLDINKPIRAVLSMIGKQLELDNISFSLELGEGLPTILAHDNRLQQVFFNLLTNARDAINEKSAAGNPGMREITIRTRSAEGRVVAEVSDTGVGIPEADQRKVFEPFFTTKATGQGMGLGLAITYGIVRDYGGTIDIRSAYGEGTTFGLSFPTSAGDQRKSA